MAEEDEQVVMLQTDFYRDGIGKFLAILIASVAVLLILIATSVYLLLNKPQPRTFLVGEDWRVQHPVPVTQPYLTTADLLQWVSTAVPSAFTYDFLNYNEQLKNASKFFTTDGWKVFLNQLNNYVNYNNVQSDRMFVSAAPKGAPIILQQGIISGRYGWWVQLPIEITYQGNSRVPANTVTLQLLVVRVSTKNNLTGVGIDNVIVAKSFAKPGAGT